MDFAKNYLLLLVSSVLIQNIVFARGIGITSILYTGRQAASRFLFGGLLTLMTMLTALACYALRAPLEATGLQGYLYPLVFLAVTAVIFTLLYLAAGLFLPRIFAVIAPVLPSAAFSCALFGTLLLTVYQKLNLPQTMVFAFGTGVGYLLAIWLIDEGRRRMDIARVPEAFRGLPITLLYIGILSLALFGFIGNHTLPY